MNDETLSTAGYRNRRTERTAREQYRNERRAIFRARRQQIVETMKDADWKNKSNHELAAEFGLQPQQVLSLRNKLRAPLYNYMAVRKRELLKRFENVDWNLQDTQIAKQINSSNSDVRRWRIALGKPPSPNIWKRTVARLVLKYKDLDWENNRDIDLSIQLGLSRERVRQIRIALKRPCCKFAGCHKKMIQFRQIFADHIESKTPVPWEDFQAIFPNSGKEIYDRWSRSAGLEPVRRENRGPKAKYYWQHLDWRLPNIFLSRIWNIPRSHIGAKRYEFHLGEPAWHPASIMPPEMVPVIEAQKALAANPPDKPMGMQKLWRNNRIKLADAAGNQGEGSQVRENLQH